MFYGPDMNVARIHWAARLDGKGSWTALLLGTSITIGFLLLRCVFDCVFLATWGFPDGLEPLWRSDIWWPEIVNATLIGYLPAVLLIARPE